MRLRVLIAALLVATVGCTGTLRHTAVAVDAGLYEALNNAHVLEQQTLCGQSTCANTLARFTPGWTDAKSQTFNQALLPAVESGRQFNALLAAWKPGTPMPREIHDLIKALAYALTQVTGDFPEGSTKTAVIADLAKAQAAALSALDLYLAVKGGV